MFTPCLNDMKARLAEAIPTIKTVKVGIEANLSPADYPMLRIVPNMFRRSENFNYRHCDLYIYIGLPLIEGQTSLEQIYDDLLAAEQKVIKAVRQGIGYKNQYMRTIISDKNVTEHYRLACVILQTTFSSDYN